MRNSGRRFRSGAGTFSCFAAAAPHELFRTLVYYLWVMSSLFSTRTIAALVLGIILCGRIAIANVPSIEGALSSQLALPGLLSPIASNGRNGWNCAAERAAQARHWAPAALPP
jgi:hypothetical protein